MEKLLQQLLEGQQKLFEGQAEIIKHLDNLENTMVTTVDFYKSMNAEQKDLIVLLEKIATKESITRLDTKFDLLNTKLFQTDTEIALLRHSK